MTELATNNDTSKQKATVIVKRVAFSILAVVIFIFVAFRFVLYGNVIGVITGCEYVTKKVEIPSELKNVELTLREPAYLVTGPSSSDCAARKPVAGRIIYYNYYHQGSTDRTGYYEDRGKNFSLYEGSNKFTIDSIVNEYNTGLLTVFGPVPTLILADENGDLYELFTPNMTRSSDRVSGRVVLEYQTPEGETVVLSLDYLEENLGL